MKSQLPSIIEFIESPAWLDMKGILNPMERLVMKLLYRGTNGNNFGLAADEMSLYKNLPQWKKALGSVSFSEPIKEFGLIAGRRSGKSNFLAICALYEIHRVLNKKIDTNDQVGICTNAPVAIWVFSPSKTQLDSAHRAIDNLVKNNTHIMPPYTYGGDTSGEHFISFPRIKKRPEIRIMFSCNPDITGIIGLNTFSILIDEPASFTGCKAGSIHRIAKPQLWSSSYRLLEDGKFILASTPRYKKGFLWDFFTQSSSQKLVLQAATWIMRPENSKESLKGAYSNLSEEEFNMEFGAEFGEPPESITEQVTLRLNSELINVIKKQAREIAYKEDQDITYTDVIRKTLEEKFRMSYNF